MKYYHRIINYLIGKRLKKAEADLKKIKKHPLRSAIFTWIISIMMVVTLLGMFMITTPAFKNFATYTIDKYMSYTTAVDDINERMNNIENMSQNVADAIVEKITKEKKNPDLHGIQISGNDFITIQPSCKTGLSSIYLSDLNNNKTQSFLYLVVTWAKQEKYDAIILGSMYVGLDGTLYWSDGVNPDYDTDMELIVDVLKKKNRKNIFMFSPNHDRRSFGREIKYINGSIVIKKIQSFKYRIPFTNKHFYKDGFKTIIAADNFQATLFQEKFDVLVKPGKNNEPKILVNKSRRKDVIFIRDKIRDSLKGGLQWGIGQL